MERLALATEKRIKPNKVANDGCYVNLSGLENQALKLYNSGEEKGTVAAFVFESIGLAIKVMCKGLIAKYGNLQFVFAGGVMCNSIIKKRLSERYDCSFAEIKSKDCTIRIEGDGFSFSACPYSTTELATKMHDDELVSDGTYINIDYVMEGIGSNSCGPLPTVENYIPQEAKKSITLIIK
jgi:hypothetical protein